ncbi:MAG: hypothetical protein HETSPECPRED_009783 [Heterodermia speciosa]|uniref:Uncharacterized protein n=1 Tax=Heterodermia speciosa TaxID=116794 RepID=A0A8H3G2F5_9LECA|nr:MAG: hypothetical protein HETSPECPRED_009783 [Heterodermia speciosa]
MFYILSLPREMRNKIYGSCLVRETIEFEEFYVDETAEEWMQDRKPDTLTLHAAKPDETPLLVYQGVPYVHRVGSLVPVYGRCRWDDMVSEGRKRSYRIHRGTANPPYLNILLTNHQVYDEASSIFYGNNHFRFPSRNCELAVNACSGFLTDRSKQALTYVSKISLSIGYFGWQDMELNGWQGSRFRGIHWPTIECFGNILRGARGPLGLKKLEVLIEDQCPSDRAIATRLRSEDKDYFSIFCPPSAFQERANSLRNLEHFQIEMVERDGDFRMFLWERSLKSLAGFLIGLSSSDIIKYDDPIKKVDGKEVVRGKLTVSVSKTG